MAEALEFAKLLRGWMIALASLLDALTSHPTLLGTGREQRSPRLAGESTSTAPPWAELEDLRRREEAAGASPSLRVKLDHRAGSF